MSRRDRTILWAAIALTLLATAYGVMWTRSIRSLTGAVLRQDSRPENQLPIPGVEIDASDDAPESRTMSEPSGYFHLNLRRAVRKGGTLRLRLRHPDYQPLEITVPAADRLLVIRMIPASVPVPEARVVISDVRLRYAMASRTTQNVGSVVKVFEVPNTGDVTCHASELCSPDGKWKAAIGGAAVDAGEDSEFREARVSCIAGPCPFTRIEKDMFSQGGQRISVLVRNWSDEASFVLDAEVMRALTTDAILEAYPVIFGQTASFTLPAKAEGPSIRAVVDHQEIVYPLGPKPGLSWADCDVQSDRDLTKIYRCVLKPGYRFQ